MVLDANGLATGVVGVPDLFGERGFGQQLADAVDRRSATEGGMWTLPVEEGPPFGQLVAEARAFQVGRSPELLQGGALGALDFPVEVG